MSEVVLRWYTACVPTRHHRIQVTEDAELSEALRVAGPHLPAGLSRAGQVRELALTGARQLASGQRSESERRALLEALAQRFDQTPQSDIDWDAMRDGKRRAWPSQ